MCCSPLVDMNLFCLKKKGHLGSCKRGKSIVFCVSGGSLEGELSLKDGLLI